MFTWAKDDYFVENMIEVERGRKEERESWRVIITMR